MVEVDENVAELGKLAQKLSLGPTRKDFLKLLKKANPETPFPEVDADEAITAATAPLLSEIEKLKQNQAHEQSMKNLAERRKPVAHLPAEDLKSLEQFMIDKGIADYEIALREKTRLDAVAAPRPAGRFGRAEMPTPDKDNALYKDPAGFRNRTLHNLIDDLHAGKAI